MKTFNEFRCHAADCLNLAKEIEALHRRIKRSIAVDPSEGTTRPRKAFETIADLYALARTKDEREALESRSFKVLCLYSDLFQLFDSIKIRKDGAFE